MVGSDSRKERELIEPGRFVFQGKITDLRVWLLMAIMGLKTEFRLMPTKQQGKTSKSLLPV